MVALLDRFLLLVALLCAGAFVGIDARAERIKDIASVQGVRPNQLIGYGLVVGLDGSGDQTTQTPFTVQSISTMLGHMGINLPPGTSLQLKNVAAVMVTAVQPAFAQPGHQLDITVSSMGNAKSLRGGTLLLTPLKGVDGRIYAMAQGNLVVGGAGAAQGGASAQVNHLAAGRVPGGATVERNVHSTILEGDTVQLQLHTADFSTAQRVAQAINTKLGMESAQALNGRTIRVLAPRGPNDRVSFLSELENIAITVAAAPARVIINARTGSVVMNQAVRLESSAVAHGNLSVSISSTPVISQPAPFAAGGQTVVAEKADISIQQDGGKIVLLEEGARLADVVKALNLLGATPQDLLSILQALKAAGALRAELEII